MDTLHLRPRAVIIAHRGASGHALENTLHAFRKAMELKADMIELDVFRLQDGQVVCFHDDNLKRLTGVKGRITDYTLADLNQLTLTDGSHIPLLSDALKVIDKQVRVNIELKGSNTAGATYLVIQDFINNHRWKLEDFHISSFKHDQLKVMRRLNNRIEIGILPKFRTLAVLGLAKEIDAFSINAYQRTLTAASVKKMHAAGLKVNAWTVNKPRDIRRMLKLGVDGIITNYPDRVQRACEER